MGSVTEPAAGQVDRRGQVAPYGGVAERRVRHGNPEDVDGPRERERVVVAGVGDGEEAGPSPGARRRGKPEGVNGRLGDPDRAGASLTWARKVQPQKLREINSFFNFSSYSCTNLHGTL